MNIREKINFLAFILIGYALVIINAAVFLGSNFAYKGFSPNPFMILCLLACLFYSSEKTLVYSTLTIAVYLVFYYRQTDYQAVDSMFTGEVLATVFFMLAFPMILSEILDHRRISIEKLRADADERDLILRDLRVENRQTKEAMEALGRKYTAHSLSDIEILELIGSTLDFKLEHWARGLQQFASRYLGSESISIRYRDFKHTSSVAGESTSAMEALFKACAETENVGFLTARNQAWPLKSLNGAAFPISHEGRMEGMVFVEDIPFQHMINENLDRFFTLVKMSTSYFRIHRQMQELKSKQANYLGTNIFSPHMYMELLPRIKGQLGNGDGRVKSYSINVSGRWDELTEVVLCDKWSELATSSEFIFKTPEKGGFYYLNYANNQTTDSPLLEHLKQQSSMQRGQSAYAIILTAGEGA